MMIVKPKKIRSTHLLVGIFLIILALAMCAESEAEPYVGLGYSFFNGSSTVGEVGYRWGRWDAQAALYGAGETRNGYQNVTEIYSFSRIVEPGWMGNRFFMRLGVAYVDDHRLVGRRNYRLGFGLDLGRWDLEFTHYSSAGINPTNTGIDALILRAKF